MSARPTRLEARFELPGRGERTVIRATSRRVMPATVRRLGSGQPAVPPADDFVAVATRGAAAVGGSLTGPRNALRETPYAPRAPPGSGGASLHAG